MISCNIHFLQVFIGMFKNSCRLFFHPFHFENLGFLHKEKGIDDLVETLPWKMMAIIFQITVMYKDIDLKNGKTF